MKISGFPWLKNSTELELTDEQHDWLTSGLFERTVKLLLSLRSIRDVIVITWNTQTLATARTLGAHTIHGNPSVDPNQQLCRATLVVKRGWANSVLIVPANLPMLEREDLEAVLGFPPYGNLVVIAPDRHESGTNLLYIRPPGLIHYAFGPNSFISHMQLAQDSGATVGIYYSKQVAFDIDTPDDAAEYYRRMAEEPTGELK